MRTTGFLALAGVIAILPMSAGAQTINTRVAKAMPSRYVEGTCGLKPGHFLVSSANLYLKTGTEQSDPQKKATQFESGIRVAVQAITEAGQEENAAAWYALGRIYLQQGDLVGADSAFTRVEKFAPDCVEDVKSWRQRAWMPLMTPGTEFFRTGQNDSALALFKEAAMISPSLPQSHYNAGVLFANLGMTDSAIVYLRKAKDVAAANAREFGKDRNAATFNLAAMLQRADRHQEAAEELKAYVAWDPSDVDAKRALAQSLRATGQDEAAAAIDRELLAAAEASGTLTAGDIMGMGITFFNDKKYAEAAEAFGRVLEKEPSNRDALFNMANAYYALQDGPKLVDAASRLVAAEPLSEDSWKLLSQGYRIENNQEKLLEAVTKLMEHTIGVNITSFRPAATGAALEAQAYGRDAQTIDGKAIPATTQTLAFEFVNDKGEVVATAEAQVPPLAAGATHDLSVAVEGAGIMGWRYTYK